MPLPMPTSAKRPRPLDLRYDIDRDQVTIDGVKYSGDFFRAFTLGEGRSRTVRIFKDMSGQVTVQRLDVDIDDLVFSAWPDRSDIGAHVLVNGEPLCLNPSKANGRRCEYESFTLAHASMRVLEEHSSDVFETVSGPCPHCVKQRTGAAATH